MTGFVAHLVAVCFYVSAERVRHPDLRGKAVGVLVNYGACVIAKNYEMKAKGVKTGTPVWDAKALCSDGVYVKRESHWYEVLSRQMLAVVGECSPTVEYYSIDEFFFHAEPHLPGEPLADTARHIRDRILAEIGLPVIIGVCRTRTLAKLFSETAKPFGCTAVLTRARAGVVGQAAGDRDQRYRLAAGGLTAPLRHPHVPGPGRRRRIAREEGAHVHRFRHLARTERHAREPRPPGPPPRTRCSPAAARSWAT